MLSTGRNTTDIKAIEIVSQVLLSLGNPSLSSKAEIYSSFISETCMHGLSPWCWWLSCIQGFVRASRMNSPMIGGEDLQGPPAKDRIIHAKSICSSGFPITAAQDHSEQDLPLLKENMRNSSCFRPRCFIVHQRGPWLIATTGRLSETCYLHRITYFGYLQWSGDLSPCSYFPGPRF